MDSERLRLQEDIPEWVVETPEGECSASRGKFCRAAGAGIGDDD